MSDQDDSVQLVAPLPDREGQGKAEAGDRARSRGGRRGALSSRARDRGQPVGCRADGGRCVGKGVHTLD